jgi:Mor family transcriptional regulator
MLEKTERNEKIFYDKEEKGLTYRVLEKKYGICRDTIQKIIYRWRKNQQIDQYKQHLGKE